MELGSFVRLQDGSIARVFSATKLQLLSGRLVNSSDEVVIGPIKYSEDYSQLVNAVFDLARDLHNDE